MRTIWKFPLSIRDSQSIPMPDGAKLLAAQMQDGGTLHLWAEVDTTQPSVLRLIHIYGTGNPIPDEPGEYVGTVQERVFVWHIYAGSI